jgi:hypothetical protein
MKNDKKKILMEEQLRKIRYYNNYRINESPRYRPLVDNNEEFDNLPVEVYNTDDGQAVPQSPSFTNEAGDQEDAIKPQGNEPPAPSNDLPIETGEPNTGETDANEIPDDSINPEDTELNNPESVQSVQPEQNVNDIQNEIIKHNIAAMQSIHDELEGLNSTVQGLNSKLESLNTEVEEVREPTNSEKLMSKTNVSYPYYFNLNDFWKGNWFNEKRNEEMEKGVRELPDGTFIADFDDLPEKSKTDVQNSFNEFI